MYLPLTGKLIFEGRSAVEVMFHHAHTPPPRPSTRSELPIPGPLEDLVMQCLEKDPARRPISAEAVSTRLDTVSLESAWTVERAERWWATTGLCRRTSAGWRRCCCPRRGGSCGSGPG